MNDAPLSSIISHCGNVPTEHCGWDEKRMGKKKKKKSGVVVAVETVLIDDSL